MLVSEEHAYSRFKGGVGGKGRIEVPHLGLPCSSSPWYYTHNSGGGLSSQKEYVHIFIHTRGGRCALKRVGSACHLERHRSLYNIYSNVFTKTSCSRKTRNLHAPQQGFSSIHTVTSPGSRKLSSNEEGKERQSQYITGWKLVALKTILRCLFYMQTTTYSYTYTGSERKARRLLKC